MHQVLGISPKLLSLLSKCLVLCLNLAKIMFLVSQGPLILFDLLLRSILHLDEFLLILNQSLSKSVDLMHHSFLLQFIDIACTLCLIQVLIFLCDVHKQPLNKR